MDTPWSRLDARVDLYSLGGILQWLFRDELHNDAQPQMNTLGQVITRSHAHDAEARYSSCDAMLGDLKAIIQADMGQESASLSEDVRALAVRHPKAAIVGGLAVVTMLAAIITLISLLA